MIYSLKKSILKNYLKVQFSRLLAGKMKTKESKQNWKLELIGYWDKFYHVIQCQFFSVEICAGIRLHFAQKLHDPMYEHIGIDVFKKN